MTLTQQVLKRAPERFSAFDYYEIIVDKILENRSDNPDIAIESCKSLVEGLSKSILKHARRPYIEKGRKKDELYDLFKKAVTALGELGGNVEEDFTWAAGGLVHKLGAIRNDRGDISHGRSAPKEASSSIHFASFVIQATDGLVSFLLEELFALDLTRFDQIEYEDNHDFNDYLDELFPIEGGLSYSKALFDQDLVIYGEQLKDFISDKEAEAERENKVCESAYVVDLTDMKPTPSSVEASQDPVE